MLVIGLILNLFGIGLFCWLIFTFAVYEPPFFALTAGIAAFHWRRRRSRCIPCRRTHTRHRSSDVHARSTDVSARSDRYVFAIPAAIAG